MIKKYAAPEGRGFFSLILFLIPHEKELVRSLFSHEERTKLMKEDFVHYFVRSSFSEQSKYLLFHGGAVLFQDILFLL